MPDPSLLAAGGPAVVLSPKWKIDFRDSGACRGELEVPEGYFCMIPVAYSRGLDGGNTTTVKWKIERYAGGGWVMHDQGHRLAGSEYASYVGRGSPPGRYRFEVTQDNYHAVAEGVFLAVFPAVGA